MNDPICPGCEQPTQPETSLTEWRKDEGQMHYWHRPCWWERSKAVRGPSAPA